MGQLPGMTTRRILPLLLLACGLAAPAAAQPILVASCPDMTFFLSAQHGDTRSINLTIQNRSPAPVIVSVNPVQRLMPVGFTAFPPRSVRVRAGGTDASMTVARAREGLRIIQPMLDMVRDGANIACTPG